MTVYINITKGLILSGGALPSAFSTHAQATRSGLHDESARPDLILGADRNLNLGRGVGSVDSTGIQITPSTFTPYIPVVYREHKRHRKKCLRGVPVSVQKNIRHTNKNTMSGTHIELGLTPDLLARVDVNPPLRSPHVVN